MKYDFQKRIFLLKNYNKFENISAVQRAYRTKYQNETAPSRSVIFNIVFVFEKKNRSQKLACNNGKGFPSLSIRNVASAVGVSLTFLYLILHGDLHLKPYKYQQWHKLEENYFEKKSNSHSGSLPRAIKFFFKCSDEAYFYQ